MNIPQMHEFIQANLTALLGLNKPSADGFVPAITRERLKSALAQSIERAEQELNGVPNPIVLFQCCKQICCDLFGYSEVIHHGMHVDHVFSRY